MDKIYRVKLWRFGTYDIDECEVIKRTKKTVTIEDPYYKRGSCGYHLSSQDYSFFDTLELAELAVENLVVNKMQESIQRTEELRTRLQEVCKHREINARTKKCHRCGLK